MAQKKKSNKKIASAKPKLTKIESIFTIYFDQHRTEDYEVVVEAPSAKSITDQWDDISDIIDDYCTNAIIEGGQKSKKKLFRIPKYEIALVPTTAKDLDSNIEGEEIVSVLKWKE